MFCLQTIPPQPYLPSGSARVAKLAGFSLHAGVAARADQRNMIERLCRYIARLAALVPKPRVNLNRFHGVFAPNNTCFHELPAND